MFTLKYILIAGLCFMPLLGHGEIISSRSDYNVRLWQMEDGLPNNTVQAIAQTRDGYLWVGTREGLARFDGVKFQTVDLIPGHASLSISSLHQSHDGSLWIGTDNAGLFRLSSGGMERCKGLNDALNFEVHEI